MKLLLGTPYTAHVVVSKPLSFTFPKGKRTLSLSVPISESRRYEKATATTASCISTSQLFWGAEGFLASPLLCRSSPGSIVTLDGCTAALGAPSNSSKSLAFNVRVAPSWRWRGAAAETAERLQAQGDDTVG